MNKTWGKAKELKGQKKKADKMDYQEEESTQKKKNMGLMKEAAKPRLKKGGGGDVLQAQYQVVE